MNFNVDRVFAHVLAESEDDEREILRAIVKASFELARPVGLSAVDYLPEHCLNDSEVDSLIRSVPRTHDSLVVEMDFVRGRRCKTIVSKRTAGHFLLDVRFFERYRGSCIPILERARDLINENKAPEREKQSSDKAPRCMAAGSSY